MIEATLAAVRRRWHELEPGDPPPLRYVLQSRRRVILFLFDHTPRTEPVAVVKISRDRAGNAVLERSVEILNMLQREIADPAVARTLPAPLLLDPIHGLSASVERCLPGVPMTPAPPLLLAGARHHRRNFAAWREWLLPFQRATGAGEQSSCCWRVGDAHYSNLLLSGAQVSGVVDWEGAEPAVPVVVDWLQFGFQYAVELAKIRGRTGRDESGLRAVEVLADPRSSPLAAVVWRETEAFLAAWEIAPEAHPDLLMTFMEHLHWAGDKPALVRYAAQLLRERRGGAV